MEKNVRNSYSSPLDSIKIINLEQMDKFPYCFVGLVYSQNKNNIKKKSIGFIIGEDIIITNNQDIDNDIETLSFLPFTTGQFKLYNKPIKEIKHINILIDSETNSETIFIVIIILERKIGKEIVYMLKLNSYPQFQIKNELYSFFQSHCNFNEKNKNMIMNGFWEKKLLILSYINPNQYYYKQSDKNNLLSIESSTLLNLNNEENPKNKEMENKFFLICNKKFIDKNPNFSNSFYNINKDDNIISEIKKKLRISKNENLLIYEKISLFSGSPLFIETNFGLFFSGLSTKLTKKNNNSSFQSNNIEDSIGIALTQNIYNIIENKIKLFKDFYVNKIKIENLFYYENIFINFFQKDIILIKGIFKRDIPCENLFEICEKLIEISKNYFDLKFNNGNNNIIIKYDNKQKFSDFIKNKSNIYYDLNIEININDLSSNFIQIIHSNKQFKKAKTEKNLEYILFIIKNIIDNQIKNQLLNSLLLNDIIQKISKELEE